MPRPDTICKNNGSYQLHSFGKPDCPLCADTPSAVTSVIRFECMKDDRLEVLIDFLDMDMSDVPNLLSRKANRYETCRSDKIIITHRMETYR